MPVVFEATARFKDEASQGLERLEGQLRDVAQESRALEQAAGGVRTWGQAVDTLAPEQLQKVEGVVRRLGPAVGDLNQQLRERAAVQQAAQDYLTLKDAWAAGVVSSADFGRAVRGLNDGLKAGGSGVDAFTSKVGREGVRAASQMSGALSGVALVATTAGGSLGQLGQSILVITNVTGAITGLAGAAKGLLALLAGAGGLLAASAAVGAVLGTVAGKFLATLPAVDAVTSTLAQYTASGKAAQVSQEALGLTAVQTAARQERLAEATEEARIGLVQIAAAAAAAAAQRAQAEAEARGDVLGSLQIELVARQAQIRATLDATTQGSVERAAAEAAVADQLVALEIDTAARRTAAISQFVAEAIGLAQGLGAGFEDLAKKLQITQAIEQNAQALQTFTQLAQAGVITTKEFAAVQTELKAQFDALAQGVLPAAAAVEQFGQTVQTAAAASAQTFGPMLTDLGQLEIEIGRLDQAMADFGTTGATAFEEIITKAENLSVSLAQVEAGLTDLAGAVPSPGPGAGPIVSGPGSLRQLGGARTFQVGGVVPGPSGAPRVIIAEGQETIRTPAQEAALAQGASPTVNITLAGTQIIQSGRAMQDLSERMINLITDSIRRRR